MKLETRKITVMQMLEIIYEKSILARTIENSII